MALERRTVWMLGGIKRLRGSGNFASPRAAGEGAAKPRGQGQGV